MERIVVAVSTRFGREFRELAGVQPGPPGVSGRGAAGRPTADAHPPPPVPDGVRVDGRPADDAVGGSPALAQLGRDSIVRLPPGHYRLHHRPPLRRCSS